MNWDHKIRSIFVIVSLAAIAIFMGASTKQSAVDTDQRVQNRIQGPPCVQVYRAIEKYAPENGVPKRIAYNVALHETGYKGPLDIKYKANLVSSTGAAGPMQILPSTATYLAGRKVSREELLTDVNLNVKLSMKMLSDLKKRYGSWDIALGYYNTGYPVVNDYARSIANDPVKIKKSI